MHTRMPDTVAARPTEVGVQPATRGTGAPATRLRLAGQSPLPGRLAVEFLYEPGSGRRRLDQRPAGTLVTATGTVTALHIVGSAEPPRLTVTLTGTGGESALCSVDTDHYLDLCTYLYGGTEVLVSGKVRRPADGPPVLIDALAIRPACFVRPPADRTGRPGERPAPHGRVCAAAGSSSRPLPRTSRISGSAR
ncbi:hypothetical protein [Streptomyces yaizuensis]|uniref:Uncharacterized protein n=1 Tax=Streptomyces yaizuensis TaxID=2989713 RepID=A0ABQ5P6G7_9ACTN|nr:hypothetical protein [Streptomyces sp. YSPA8]GLF98188.1 hypothetical protein SYYSPA8_27845 [Streptomyces sp. YSPA8]